ncbi:hypothetical protein D3C80_941130 [compost metagenome]
MAAGVDKGVEHTVLVARDEDRLAPHGGGVEIVDVGDLAFVGQIQPVAFEDVFHLQIEQPGVGEHLALAAIEALLGIVFKQGMQIFGSQGHGRRLHCYCSGRGHARTGGQAGISAQCRPLSVLCSVFFVGASLLAKNLRALRGVRFPASSLTSIASRLAPTVDRAPLLAPQCRRLRVSDGNSPNCLR